VRHDAVPTPRRAVLAHGFTQTGRSWSRFQELLVTRLAGLETVAVDLPGHGDTDTAADADLWASADRLVEVGGRATYIGYSMGGRVALHAVLAHPTEVERLVLIGATAGIDDDGERAARRRADAELADRIESIGTAEFVDEWLANPLFAGLDEAAAGREDRLRNSPTGLAASLRATGTGTQTPLWHRLGEITAPVLVVAGEDDAKFAAIGQRLVAGIAGAELVLIANAGHSAHLEQPAATADAIAEWWQRTEG
jgi:2-succinyl-6-hydroxy-2,4-cyclohexadiene-1-carboxylate synthase